MELFEVLSRAPNGHRTVSWIRAEDEAAAIDVVEALLDPGGEVLDAAAAPAGLGSGD